MYDTLESMYVNQKKNIDTSIRKNHRYVNQKKSSIRQSEKNHRYVNQKKSSIRQSEKTFIRQSEKNHRYVNQKKNIDTSFRKKSHNFMPTVPHDIFVNIMNMRKNMKQIIPQN